ncbi:MAG: hypothetical protein ACYCO9_20930 [Streptosporangiaceae bacterium]
MTEAVSHFPCVLGGSARAAPGGAMMSAEVRGAGMTSLTAAISAIRLRPFFSPGDSRAATFRCAAAAAFAVAGRSPSGRITTGFPSAWSMRICSCGAGSGARSA